MAGLPGCLCPARLTALAASLLDVGVCTGLAACRGTACLAVGVRAARVGLGCAAFTGCVAATRLGTGRLLPTSLGAIYFRATSSLRAGGMPSGLRATRLTAAGLPRLCAAGLPRLTAAGLLSGLRICLRTAGLSAAGLPRLRATGLPSTLGAIPLCAATLRRLCAAGLRAICLRTSGLPSALGTTSLCATGFSTRLRTPRLAAARLRTPRIATSLTALTAITSPFTRGPPTTPSRITPTETGRVRRRGPRGVPREAVHKVVDRLLAVRVPLLHPVHHHRPRRSDQGRRDGVLRERLRVPIGVDPRRRVVDVLREVAGRR